MNLVILTALIAVCGAAKLDRTYLPPASAKTAGGSPGALQTPFARNTLNNGLGGLPKGSFQNDFDGVVVDAAAAGTRNAGPEETGLGAPRKSYGSTNSKVGAAAFKIRPTAFDSAQSEDQAQDFEGADGSFSAGAEAADLQQGSFPETQNAGFRGSFPGAQNAVSGLERQRAALDRSATILRYENEVGPENYHYAFETDNGISAEENGVATNGVQAQGGFSYTGDDGQVYTVTYTADEGGYQPKGAHLPTPPPIPEEILKSLEQNARDEAAGLLDDGSYDAQKYNAGSDYAPNDDTNGKFTHHSSQFGAEADETFLNQKQTSRRPSAGQSTVGGQVGQNFNRQTSNKYSQGGFESDSTGLEAQSGQASNGFIGQFGQTALNVEATSDDTNIEQFGQAATVSKPEANKFESITAATQNGPNKVQSRPSLGNRNEYLPPINRPNSQLQSRRPQTGRPLNGRPQTNRPQAFTDSTGSIQPNQELSNDEEGSGSAVPLGQQDLQSESRPQQAITSFGKPVSSGTSSQKGFSSSSNQIRPSNGRRPSTSGNNFNRPQSSLPGRTNEYLPPKVGSPSRKPSNQPQSFTSSPQYNQQSETNIENLDDDQTQNTPNSPIAGSQPPFGAQPQQTNSFQRPKPAKLSQNGNRFSSQGQTQSNAKPGQSTFGFTAQKATVQPATELTTPFEMSNDASVSQSGSQAPAGDFAPSLQLSNGRPTQAPFGNQYNNGQNNFNSQPAKRPQTSRPQKPRPFSQTQAFPTQSPSGQFNQFSQIVEQSSPENSFNQESDAQFASSTQRPSYTGQPQGPDDSYYYNQPSRPFGTPQASRFPSAPSNQFNRVTQQSSFAQVQSTSSPQNIPSEDVSSSPFQSTKYPRPPTVAPPSSTQVQGQFGNNYKTGSMRQPRPPTVAPPASSQSQFQSSAVNGVTQAAISPFPPQSPTQASQGQFGSRPSFQQTQYNQASKPVSSSFSQQPMKQSFGQQSAASPSFPRRSSPSSFQSQAQISEQPESQDQMSEDENEQPVPSQQYTGEIYEYSKPAVTLPPPDSTPVSASGQFGQKMPSKGQFVQSKPQFGQTTDEEQSVEPQATKPQFGGQTRPQFSQSTFGAPAQQDEDDSKPFGALAQNQAQFGSQISQQSRPQYGQSRPQLGQTQTFGQSQVNKQSGDAQPEPEIELSSDNEPQPQPEGPKKQFGFVPACCRDNASQKPDNNQIGGQRQSQFGQTFPGSQEQPTSSFAGKGEEFGGPRQPPRYDEETGYHY